jgi:hypothetical protein
MLAVTGILGLAVFGAVFMQDRYEAYPELPELSGIEWKFIDYSHYFEDLAAQKGARYAFEVLARAEFPPGIDLHLLGHVVGNVLFAQEGIDGIHACTQNFRNACSHSIVVGLFSERGVGALSDVVTACKDAPGGSGAYTMCFHGLGHGVLAYYNYDLEQALPLCKEAGASSSTGNEYVECVGGTIMEMIAGVHDREAWEKERTKYFKDNDPLYPCNAAFMPSEVQPICYIYLTPHLLQAAGIDLSSPDIEDFPKASGFCEKIPEFDRENRDACYGGFGKEFTTFAAGQDIRDVGSLSIEKVRLVSEWCGRLTTAEGTNACQLTALRSFFWGGENSPDAAFSFCALMDGDARNRCYGELAGQAGYFLSGSVRGYALCNRFPEEFRKMCLNSWRRIETP